MQSCTGLIDQLKFIITSCLSLLKAPTNMPRISFLAIFFFQLFTGPLQAQDRCSINRYEEILNKKYPNRESRETFEKWLAGKIRQQHTAYASSTTYTIPVVVHVIHNGEEVGTGANISNAQILSQIQVLNNDFKRLNADASKTPSDFIGVAGSLSVEFVLAKRSPQGLESNGIVRVNGSKAAWDLNEEGVFKALSFWPSEDYLNIWVINLSGGDIGYASFPVSSLPGMEDAVNNRLIDGVIIDYKVFGSKDGGSFDLDSRYNTGRTATHEIGHYLGLRHIWGDVSGCSGTDYVEDTPPQNGATFDCPSTHPIISCSNTAKMYQNFMDYTQDACMNLFTKKQVDRMVVVMENSPRRKSLTQSLGSISPVYGLECALTITSPQPSGCPGLVTPEVTLTSLGDQIIRSVKILPTINGARQNAITFSVTLSKGQSTIVSFPTIDIQPGDRTSFQFELLEVNGVQDELLNNNVREVTTIASSLTDLPVQEMFDTQPAGWTFVNPDGGKTWSFVPAGGGSMSVMAYNYEQTGELDALLTPVFNAQDATALLLQFDVAYARYPGNNNETLYVYMIDDCSESFSTGNLIYEKRGEALATAPDSFSDFFPNDGQWRTETIPLNTYIGRNNLRLAFVFRNSFGNNIYLDKIKLRNSPLTDLRVEQVTKPTPVVCLSEVSPKVQVVNLGTTTIRKLSGRIQIGTGVFQNIQEIITDLPSGTSSIIDLPAIRLNEGPNEVIIELLPSDLQDDDPVNNQLNSLFNRIILTDKIPARENFDKKDKWTFALNKGATPWETVGTNRGSSASYQAFSNSIIGEQAWLVSPIMDMSKVTKASLFADFSYGSYKGLPENIQIKASTNCGLSFDEMIFDGPADELVSTPVSGNFTPASDDDWTRKFFDISDLTGNDQVLFSMVITNNNGSNLFIDNIEFFADNDPEPEVIEELFRVYRDGDTKQEKITFNLEERSTVRFQLFNTAGLMVLDNLYADILNQTLTLELGLPSGLYIYRFDIAGKYYAVRHFIP